MHSQEVQQSVPCSESISFHVIVCCFKVAKQLSVQQSFLTEKAVAHPPVIFIKCYHYFHSPAIGYYYNFSVLLGWQITPEQTVQYATEEKSLLKKRSSSESLSYECFTYLKFARIKQCNQNFSSNEVCAGFSLTALEGHVYIVLFQVLHFAGAVHCSFWKASFQECNCKWPSSCQVGVYQ